MIISESLWSNASNCIHELKPRRDLEFGGLVNSSKIFHLGLCKSIFLEGLVEFLGSRSSLCISEHGPRKDLELVG